MDATFAAAKRKPENSKSSQDFMNHSLFLLLVTFYFFS